MDITNSKKRPWLRRARNITLALGITLAAGSYTAPTRAQWIVADPTQIANALVEYGKDLDRWMATADQFTKTINFWKEQLVKIESMQFSLFQMQQQFPKLPANFGVAESCPGASAFSGDITSALTSFMTSELTGDITTQQRDVCVLLQMTKNQKYEATRLYLDQINAQATSLQRLAIMRLTQIAESPGKLSSYAADTGKYTADMMQARETWQTNEQQLDAQIGMLERRQQVLSRMAINGTAKDIIGNLVNMAALKAAFAL